MAPQLKTHLSGVYGRAIQLVALCEAMEAMLIARAGDEYIQAGLCSVIAGLVMDIGQALQDDTLHGVCGDT